MKKIALLLLFFGLLSSFISRKEYTWTAIGDSITYQDNKPETSKNRISKGYMKRVTEQLPNIHYKNVGYAGWTAKAIAENINNLGIGKTDFYSIFLGTNDWWTGLPIGTLNDYTNNTGNNTVYGAYRTIIDKIRNLDANAAIILITPMQRTDFVDINNSSTVLHGSDRSKDGRFLSEYADAIKTIAKTENCRLVDLYYKSGVTVKNAVKYHRLKDPVTGEYKNYTFPNYIGIPYNAKTDEYPYPVEAIEWTTDGLHPSNKGYQKIADMLVKVFRKLGVS
ncbi:MAG: SGNH/GDSL hydrolase family protein [Pedobacter sp.]|nr:MAG: SGNH/GDSL hydrolase family protein [Pedobacter sp.]